MKLDNRSLLCFADRSTSRAWSNTLALRGADVPAHPDLTALQNVVLAAHLSLLSPTLLAKMITTFDQFSTRRLRVNIVNGDAKLMAQNGIHLSHDERRHYRLNKGPRRGVA
ncbi:MAG: hypothetical protein ABWY18_09610 [Tardiphaga sp.]